MNDQIFHNEIIANEHIVNGPMDLHFSRAFPLDSKTHFLIENLFFIKLESPLIFIYFLKEK